MQLQLIQQIRTNNFDDEQVMDKIKTMWQEASKELTEHTSDIYGVYYDYESDYKGDYSLGVGILGDETPVIAISPSENYKVFPVDHKDEQGIMKAWSKIWKLEEEGTLHRVYTVDFEKYAPNGEIEIHIAVKE
ncbi:GyrI-like domain-containing protein [Pseudogracilibacillus auburnensis]|uniref:Putative transcriptional regulator YdeE n=1 Tax=Pseudogracilibacillus auburnensis TaxID=1494959 RepID=A0A2V3W416_9BACI|nr:effector binding domain-containing protein [Pseudogracilibacillus auburnensis]PXW87924.1 putative transcriptional regulator YdeE [Pseudogracilibacillus auburnensis]